MDRLLTYTGIGARQTPPKVLADLDYIAAELASKGWCLCSGSARGADSAFGDGAPIERQEIWIPQPGSNGHRTGDPSVKLLDRDTAARAEVIDDSGPDLRHVRPGARRRRPQRERQRAAALLDRRLVAPAVLNGLVPLLPRASSGSRKAARPARWRAGTARTRGTAATDVPFRRK